MEIIISLTDGSNAHHSLISWVSPPQYTAFQVVFVGVLWTLAIPFCAVLLVGSFHLGLLGASFVLMEPRLYSEFSTHTEIIYSVVSTMYIA